ncbi:MAG: hypothetical protein LBN24_05135, partial [Mediterranea sp.]|nr:hypothetical protein [Mediterranea sp.]
KGQWQIGRPWKGAILLIAIPVVVLGIRQLYGYMLMEQGEKYAFGGQLNKATDIYQKATPILKDNGIFHFYYGSALSLKKEYNRAIEELELSCQKSSNPSSFLLLGNDYKETGKHEKAKGAYLTVINMIPSKLYPKYLLAKLFIGDKEYEEAKKWADIILNTPEKIPTTAGQEIKAEMRTFLQSNYKSLNNKRQ